MLVRTALTLGAIWLVPRVDTPLIRSYLGGRTVPGSVDDDGRLFARVETNNPGGLQYFLGQLEPSSRPWQNPAQQEEILALILFMLLDPSTWLMLFACARALSRIGDRITRIGRRRRLVPTTNLRDSKELHDVKDALSASKAYDSDQLHGQDETPKRKDARPLDDQRSGTPTPKPSPAPGTASPVALPVQIENGQSTPAAPPAQTARHTIRKYLTRLLAPFAEPSPAPLLPPEEAAQTLLRDPDSIPLTLGTVGGPSTDQLASLLGLGIGSPDTSTVDLDAWTNEERRSPAKKPIQRRRYDLEGADGNGTEADQDRDDDRLARPEDDVVLGIRLDGLFTRGLTPQTKDDAAPAINGHAHVNGTTSEPSSSEVGAHSSVKPAVAALPPVPDTPSEAREMVDLRSPFDEDEHSTPVSPCKELVKEEGERTENNEVEMEGSVSPFQMIGSRESIGPASGSGSAVFSSGNGTPFSLVSSTELAGTPFARFRPPSPHSSAPGFLLQSQISQLFAAPQPLHQAPAHMQTQFAARPPVPSFAPPMAATAGPVRRAISGGRRFAAPPSVSNIKTTAAPVTSSDTLSDGRIDREEGAKRRFIRDGPPELPSRVVPMPSEDNDSDSGSDEGSDEDWSDEEEAMPPTKSAAPLNRLATGEKMVWFAQPKNQSPSAPSSQQHSPVVARDVPFTAHLGMFNSSPTNGMRASFPPVSPPASNGPAKMTHSFNSFVPSTQAAPPAANSPNRSFPVFTPTAQLHSAFPAFVPPSAQTSSSNSITSAPLTSSFPAFQPPPFSGQSMSNGPKIWTDFTAFAPPSSTSSSFSPPTSFNAASTTSSFPSMTSGSVFAPPAPPAPGPEAYDDDFETDSDEGEEEDDEEDNDPEAEYDDDDPEEAEYEDGIEDRPGLGYEDGSSSQLSVRNWTEEDAEDDDEDEEDQTVKIAGSTEPGLEEEVQRFAEASEDDSMAEEARAQFAAAAGLKNSSRGGWRTPGADVPDVVVSLAPEELAHYASRQNWAERVAQDYDEQGAEDSDEDDDQDEITHASLASVHRREGAVVESVDLGEGHVLDAVQEEDEEPGSSPEQATFGRAARVAVDSALPPAISDSTATPDAEEPSIDGASQALVDVEAPTADSSAPTTEQSTRPLVVDRLLSSPAADETPASIPIDEVTVDTADQQSESGETTDSSVTADASQVAKKPIAAVDQEECTDPDAEAAASVEDSKPSDVGPVPAASDAEMDTVPEVPTPVLASHSINNASSRPVTPAVDSSVTVVEGEESTDNVSAPTQAPAEVEPTAQKNASEPSADEQDDAVVIEHADVKGDAAPSSIACGSSSPPGEHALPSS